MASNKIRRLLRPVGGITVGGFEVSTTGVATAGSQKFGSVGNTLTQMLFGSTILTAISCGAASSGSALVTIANLNVGDKVFVQTGSMAACSFMSGACATAASVLTFKYQNAGSAAMADTPISIQYLALR